MRRALTALLLFVVMSANPARAAGSQVAVFPFANRDETEDQPWHAVAFADLFTHALSGVPGIQLVERQRIGDILDELRLGLEGVIDDETAGQAGRTVHADYVLFGSFLDEGDTIGVEAHLVAVASNGLIGAVATNLAKAHAIEWIPSAAQELTRQMNGTAGCSWSNVLMRLPTRSYAAMERFHRGLRLFDAEQGLGAMRLFLGATQADPKFGPALYWLGRMYEKQGEFALAEVQYDRLGDAAGLGEINWMDLSQAASVLLDYGNMNGHRRLLSAMCVQGCADIRTVIELVASHGELPPTVAFVNYLAGADGESFAVCGEEGRGPECRVAIAAPGAVNFNANAGSPSPGKAVVFVAPEGRLIHTVTRLGPTTDTWTAHVNLHVNHRTRRRV